MLPLNQSYADFDGVRYPSILGRRLKAGLPGLGRPRGGKYGVVGAPDDSWLEADLPRLI
jgi:hypothetical protein